MKFLILQAAAIVDHLCQTSQSPPQQKKVRPTEGTEKPKKDDEETKESAKDEDEKMEVDAQSEQEAQPQEDKELEEEKEEEKQEEKEVTETQPAPVSSICYVLHWFSIILIL